jgi:hypothetical protein
VRCITDLRSQWFLIELLCRHCTQDPNRPRKHGSGAVSKASANAVAAKLSRLLEEDKNIKQVRSFFTYCFLHVGGEPALVFSSSLCSFPASASHVCIYLS